MRVCDFFWLVQALPQPGSVWRKRRLLKGRETVDLGQGRGGRSQGQGRNGENFGVKQWASK